MELLPTQEELEFLNLSYNKFLDIYDEIFKENFWTLEAQIRFYKEVKMFSIYSELLNYEPIIKYIQYLKRSRPPMESELSSKFIKFIRNLLIHYPLFDSWDEVYINKSLVTWNQKDSSIDKFLKTYSEQSEIKYRYFDSYNNELKYLTIKLSSNYKNGEKIYLKDIIEEKNGIKFCAILMKKTLFSQIEEIIDN